jgi:hypothetical protein
MIRELPPVEIPRDLAGRLQVLASHERARRVARWKHWCDRLKLHMDNLMRPLALPFAGGLLSALFLFGMLVPTMNISRNVQNDVPTPFYTGPSLEEMGPFAFSNEDLLVEFTVNEKGQIMDYSLPHGRSLTKLDGNLANMVLFASFTPATLFGQPTSGKVIVSFRRSLIVVRG